MANKDKLIKLNVWIIEGWIREVSLHFSINILRCGNICNIALRTSSSSYFAIVSFSRKWTCLLNMDAAPFCLSNRKQYWSKLTVQLYCCDSFWEVEGIGGRGESLLKEGGGGGVLRDIVRAKSREDKAFNSQHLACVCVYTRVKEFYGHVLQQRLIFMQRHLALCSCFYFYFCRHGNIHGYLSLLSIKMRVHWFGRKQ